MAPDDRNQSFGNEAIDVPLGGTDPPPTVPKQGAVRVTLHILKYESRTPG